MSGTQLEYVDLRDPSTRQFYMDDAPTPIEGSPLPDAPSEDPMTPPPLPRTRQPRQSKQHWSDKRPYVKTTLQQKLGLKVAFEKNGDALPDVQYSTQFGIPLKKKHTAPADRAAEWKLYSAEGTLRQEEQRPPVPTPLKRMIEVDPSITDQTMRECLVVLTNTLDQDPSRPT